ncbi:DnaJ domain-containing protein [Skermanella pratensis]|uniref:DnaJ domain-containing protein n=1 Tax=Skermanella pratensis TaxID=2233999 RepID=UPI001300FF8F|nr:DnaJ domain-containing protein [Skermanella pratensis]
MFPLFLLGIALLVGFYLLAQAFVSADPKSLAKGVKYTMIGVTVVVVFFLAITGRLATAMAVAAFALPMVLRWRALVNRVRAAAGPSGGQSSTIETSFLRMRLDHDSGRMNGEVLRGRFQGRGLDDLGLADLMDLLQECRDGDSQSAAILEAYLDRTREEDWRAGASGAGEHERGSAGSRSTGGAMTRAEAYEVLGLQPGASAGEIKDAHRRLMLKMHPDQGGSTYLAAKINQAKDLLLRS